MKHPYRAVLVTFVAVAAAVILVACSDEEPATSVVFESAPWTGGEAYEYRVSDRGVEGEGRCSLLTTPSGSDGTVALERRCTKDEFGDSGRAVVDAKTLRPRESERILTDSKKAKTVTHEITYTGDIASFTTRDGDAVRETTRELPEPTEGQTGPDWYDDESIMWMVRGLPLSDGFEAAYHHVINAGQPRILVVELAVAGPETVTVPAGTFETWRVRVQRADSSYFFWVAKDGPRQVVRARIEDVTYELLTAP